MKNQLLKTAYTLEIALFAMTACAQQSGGGQDMSGMKTDAVKPTKLTGGEVKNVDAKAGHVILKHGAIET